MRLDPNQPWVHFRMATILAGFPDRLGEAKTHAEEAVRLAPNLVEAHTFLGVLNARAGDFESARYHWRQALAIDPEFTPARNNLDRLDQGGAR